MKNQAFTLIELLVVVLIIGILAAIAVPQYQKFVAKSRFSQLLLAVNEIWKAQQLYILANGERSLDLSDLDVDIEGGTFGPGRYSSSNMKDRINFDWGACEITYNSTRSSIACFLNNISLVYSRSFSSPTNRWCCSTQKLGQELCADAIPDADRIFNPNDYCGQGDKVYLKN